MELQYFGGNCLKIVTKRASLIIDGDNAAVGAKDPARPDDIALFTVGTTKDYQSKARMVVQDPGEYEISEVSVTGIAVRGHNEDNGDPSNIIFKIVADDIRLLIMGHIHPKLTDEQLERIGTIDVLCLPVGGGGTLNGHEALEVIKEIEPKVVVPTYYADSGSKYPADVSDLETALKAMSMEPAETVSKLKLKAVELGETTRVVVLQKQS